jgi:hypothetical protein
MQKQRWRKEIVFGIILLFLGANIQTIAGEMKQLRGTLSTQNIEIPQSPQISFRDPPKEEWNKTFGGTGYDLGRSVQQTIDRGYILVGSTGSYGEDGPDVWLIKTDANGNEQWNRTFGGIKTDDGYDVQQTTDGGYIIIGDYGVYLENTTLYGDAWIIKTDSNGNELWNKTFGGAAYDFASSGQQTTDGGFIISGATSSYGSGGNDAWLIKTDLNGVMQWNKTYGGEGDESGDSVQQTKDCGYIIAGDTSSFGAGSSDVWIIKTDSNGNEQWNKTFGGTQQDNGFSIRQTKDEGYIITGWTRVNDADNFDIWLIKTDANEKELWNRTFGGDKNDVGFSVQQTTDEGYIVAGATNIYGTGSTWLIKTDGNGTEQWNETFGENSWGQSVQQTNEGGYIVLGNVYPIVPGDSDVWLIKIAPEVRLNIGINGGIGIHVTITNLGMVNVTSIPYQLQVNGGIFGRINKTINGTIDVPVGGTFSVRLMLFGFGPLTIIVKIGTEEWTKTGFIILFFVIGVK